nr:DUF805 domain-containing protein [Nevskia soli]
MSMAVNAWCLAMIAVYSYGFLPGRIDRDYASYVLWVVAAPVGYLFFRLSRGRLQDLNCPGKWSMVLAFPLIGVIILPVLCFLSGPRYTNDFGDHPEPSGFLKIAAALFNFVVALVLVPYVTRLYAPLHLG